MRPRLKVTNLRLKTKGKAPTAHANHFNFIKFTNKILFQRILHHCQRALITDRRRSRSRAMKVVNVSKRKKNDEFMCDRIVFCATIASPNICLRKIDCIERHGNIYVRIVRQCRAMNTRLKCVTRNSLKRITPSVAAALRMHSERAANRSGINWAAHCDRANGAIITIWNNGLLAIWRAPFSRHFFLLIISKC